MEKLCISSAQIDLKLNYAKSLSQLGMEKKEKIAKCLSQLGMEKTQNAYLN